MISNSSIAIEQIVAKDTTQQASEIAWTAGFHKLTHIILVDTIVVYISFFSSWFSFLLGFHSKSSLGRILYGFFSLSA
jgi:hypothetical protein